MYKRQINGRTVRLHAFIDSGNCLKDNLSGAPVAIASQEAAKQIMDNDFIRLLNGEIPAQLPGKMCIRDRAYPGFALRF